MNRSERILSARKKAKLTQEALGKKIGVSKGAISQWESGNVQNLKLENLFALEDATGVPARWIALGEERKGLITPAKVLDESRMSKLTDADVTLLRLVIERLSK